MADEQETPNDAGDEGETGDYDANDANDANDINNIIPSTTTTPPAPTIDNAVNPGGEDYDDDEPIPDFTVKLYINDSPDGVGLPTDLVNAGLTDIYGNVITTKSPWGDSVDGYTGAITQGIYDGLSGNGTDISGKGWWGSWTWSKSLLVALIGLCIIGIILGIIFMVVGKKFKKNKRAPPPPSGSATATKSVVTRGISPTANPEYSKLPTNV